MSIKVHLTQEPRNILNHVRNQQKQVTDICGLSRGRKVQVEVVGFIIPVKPDQISQQQVLALLVVMGGVGGGSQRRERNVNR